MGPILDGCGTPKKDSGTIISLNSLKSTQSETSCSWNVQSGDKILPSKDVRDKVCEVTIQNINYAQFIKDFEDLKINYIPYMIGEE